MSLRRIGKLFAANNLGQIITVLTQLLLPPAFLHAFGESLYGQWLALSAAISYLITFNYGLQTYTNMQMTIHYNRGELQETREVQSAGLRILLTAMLLFSLLLLIVFFLPLDRWLRLTLPLREAQWTVYILGCEVVANMFLSFFGNSYMVIGIPHRGQNFGNLFQFLVLLLQVPLVMKHASFPAIAGAQLAITLLGALWLIVDFSRLAPDLRPTLRYWKKGSLGSTLRPCGQYTLLYSSNVLVYQLPAILMQRLLGPAAVVVFSVTRTIYSMSRRVLNLLTYSIGPEITINFGQRNWQKLQKLYEFSERIILLLIPPLTLGSWLATPLLLQIWLHKGALYQPLFCMLLGLTVSIQSIKEHKYQFQFSTNHVKEISYLAITAYSTMLLIAVPMIRWIQLDGFTITWLLFETVQLLYLLHLNARLFGRQAQLDRAPVYHLFGIMLAGCAVFFWPAYHIAQFTYPLQGLIAVAGFLVTFVVSYRFFKVDEVRALLWGKFSKAFPLQDANG
ncbi:lipopolysaccharide biosynthesis protein [Pseudacidobacterium ailaaui]|jgi:O-antigen/teichoic acid export membrane protein|uniref:lipopolysaccharide biosynthesis protein n=1 Tax=Pseudacidobacterium ailaaui TaxID=1382359 RepID=UPI00047AC079|nr:flippase [Pseudacidobacterium ailaaui]